MAEIQATLSSPQVVTFSKSEKQMTEKQHKLRPLIFLRHESFQSSFYSQLAPVRTCTVTIIDATGEQYNFENFHGGEMRGGVCAVFPTSI